MLGMVEAAWATAALENLVVEIYHFSLYNLVVIGSPDLCPIHVDIA